MMSSSNKSYDQDQELLRAVFRNMYYKEKCQYLDSECRMLAEHVVSTQVLNENENEDKIMMESQLNELRLGHDQKVQELNRIEEQTVKMWSVLDDVKSSVDLSFTEYKSINELIDAQDERIKCLHEELVQQRLIAEESWAVVRVLQQTVQELESEKKIMEADQPKTISSLQEDLMVTKLSETQLLSEFATIRKELVRLTENCNEHKKGFSYEEDRSGEGRVKVHKKGVFWFGNNKKKDDTLLTKTKMLETEKNYLQSKIHEIQSKTDILQKHVQLKLEEKRQIEQNLNSFKIKQQSTENMTLERQRQYIHLETSGNDKIDEIRMSCDDKAERIRELNYRLEELSQEAEDPATNTTNLDLKEKKTSDLENQVLMLEEKVHSLTYEVNQLYEELAVNKMTL